MASFFDAIIKQASQAGKTIVLPEGNDIRTLEAAAEILDRKSANLVIMGDVPTLEKGLRSYGADPSKIQLVNPKTDPRLEEYALAFYEYRKHKGVTLEQARETVRDEVYFGTMMVKLGAADGLVAGACHSTGDTLRPALQIIKPAPASAPSPVCFLCAGRTKCSCSPTAA
jgi:phosphate acetyltransferase